MSPLTPHCRAAANPGFAGCSASWTWRFFVTAPALNAVIDDYAARNGIALTHAYEAENISAAISLITSTSGMTLFPYSVRNMLPSSVVARPLHGEAPTIDLMMGYNKSNTSPLLKRFLSRVDELVTRVAQKQNSLQR